VLSVIAHTVVSVALIVAYVVVVVTVGETAADKVLILLGGYIGGAATQAGARKLDEVRNGG
jgi:hypothetical protein